MFGIGTALAGIGINFVKDLIADNGEDLVKKGIEKVTGIDLNKKEVKDLTPQERAAIIEAELEIKSLDFKLLELSQKNVDGARDMQKTALNQSDEFSKRFVYYLASFWSVFGTLYILGITFLELPEANTRFADTILGFLLGTIISTIMNYFYGTSKVSDENTSDIQKVIKEKVNK